MKNPEDISWLLANIKVLNNDGKRPTRRDIFRGCYDVWYCEQDMIDATEIPNRRLAEAKEQGLIEDFPNPRNENWLPHWKLTEAGEHYLNEHPY
jgi:hypothetical protein